MQKSFLVTEVLSFFLGFLGVHRYYTGYIGIGILQTLTLGGCGIWSLIDFIFISLGKYKDAKGQELEGYDMRIGLGALIFSAVVSAFLMITRPASNKTTINNYTSSSASQEKSEQVKFEHATCTVYANAHACLGELSDDDKVKLEEIKARLK